MAPANLSIDTHGVEERRKLSPSGKPETIRQLLQRIDGVYRHRVINETRLRVYCVDGVDPGLSGVEEGFDRLESRLVEHMFERGWRVRNVFTDDAGICVDFVPIDLGEVAPLIEAENESGDE